MDRAEVLKVELNEDQRCLVCGVGLSSAAHPSSLCKNCGFEGKLSTEKIYETTFDSTVVGYPEDGAVHTLEVEDRSFWFSHRHHIISAVMDRFPVKGTVLDVGGGNGYEALRLQAQNPIILIEPGFPGCLAARRRGVSRVVHGTLESLKLRNSVVHGACFFDVLEHLDDPAGILFETNRILKKGGRVYVTVPAFRFLWSDEDDYAQHRQRYTRKSLNELLSHAGFKIDYMSYYFRALVLPIFLLRTVPSLIGMRKVETMNKSEHEAGGVVQKIIHFLLRRELLGVKNGKQFHLGSSLVCVATKVKETHP